MPATESRSQTHVQSLMQSLSLERATTFADIALANVAREFPNKLDHVMNGPDDVRSPRALHPIFYGSFDWHSCVHGYWLLTHLHRRFPALPEAAIQACTVASWATAASSG